jgi:steroid delta-isomerase
MGSAPDTTQAITETVHRYIGLVAGGSPDDLVDLYAEDATLEDPVGGEVHIGRQSIRGFYATLSNLQRDCELVTLRVAGNEAAFHFRLTLTAGDNRMRIEPIDVMVFDDDGKVAAMKAYWSPADVTQL